MDISLVRKKLNEVTNNIPVVEYQDKYYFLKKIKSIFPEFSNQKIAEAIEFANKKAKFSGKKKKYVNALSCKMFFP